MLGGNLIRMFNYRILRFFIVYDINILIGRFK